MTSPHFDERSFETKLDSLKDELLSSGLTPESYVKLERLIETLDIRVQDRQFTRDLIVSISNNIAKNPMQEFRLSQFFEACSGFRRNAQLKTENAQIHLAKLQNEKVEVSEALRQIKAADQANPAGTSRHGTLVLDVSGLQGLKVPHAKPIYVKLTCYNAHYKTSTQPYSEQMIWNDKYMFELLTGFDRVDVQVMSNDKYADEFIGEAQLHVSNIKDREYHKEWTGLYAKNYTQVGSILLGMQMKGSKSEYLNQVLVKLEEHIKLQIEEIEENEKRLRNFNILIGSPSVPATHSRERLSHKARSNSGNFKSAADITGNKYFHTILEEDDARSIMTTTEVGDVKMPDFSKLPRAIENYETEPFEYKNSVRGMHFDREHRMSDKRSRSPTKEEYQERTSFKNLQFGGGRESPAFNSLTETRSHSQTPVKSSSMTRTDSLDKDSIINYLQKNLNEATLENQRLSKIIEDLTQENQVMFVKETLHTKEYKKKMQEYETKIFGLVSEIERLDKTTNRKGNTTEYAHAINNIDLERNVKQLQDENIKLVQSLAKKAQEVDSLKMQLKEERERNRENAQLTVRVPEENLARVGKSDGHAIARKKFQLNDTDPYIPNYEKVSPKNGVPSWTVKGGKKLSLFPSLPFH